MNSHIRACRSKLYCIFSGGNYAKGQSECIEETNKGHQMLKKMGWGGSGTGLGSKGQGIEAPISGGDVRDRQDQYKGVGINLNDPYENFRKNKGQAFIHRMRTRDNERKKYFNLFACQQEENLLIYCISFLFLAGLNKH